MNNLDFEIIGDTPHLPKGLRKDLQVEEEWQELKAISAVQEFQDKLLKLLKNAITRNYR